MHECVAVGIPRAALLTLDISISEPPLKYEAPALLPSWDSVQFSSVTQPCLTLCNSMDCSTPGLPVHHPPSSSEPQPAALPPPQHQRECSLFLARSGRGVGSLPRGVPSRLRGSAGHGFQENTGRTPLPHCLLSFGLCFWSNLSTSLSPAKKKYGSVD